MIEPLTILYFRLTRVWVRQWPRLRQIHASVTSDLRALGSGLQCA